MSAALRAVLRIEAEVDERVVALAGLHDDIAALAAVAAGRPAPRDKFFPPKGHAAIAAVPSLDPDFCLINKHGHAKQVMPNMVTQNVVTQNQRGKQKASSRRRGSMKRALPTYDSFEALLLYFHGL